MPLANEWIYKIDITNPSIADKIRLLKYFIGSFCICSQSKSPYRWDCIECSKSRNKLIESNLKKACKEHVYCGVELLQSHIKRINHVDP